ncbi:MAG: hypothetical protein KA132_06395, partial [Thauera sp.]|nr:hypothetical protein [Thauera sp.]
MLALGHDLRLELCAVPAAASPTIVYPLRFQQSVHVSTSLGGHYPLCSAAPWIRVIPGRLRDSYRHAPVVSAQTAALKTKIVEIAHTRRRFGYRRV